MAIAALQAPSALADVRATPDPTWQTNGRVQAIVYHNGVVYLGGTFTAVRPASGGTQVTRSRVAAFDEDTGALLPFDAGANGTVRALAISGSTLYLGGSFTAVNGTSRGRLAAVDASTGSLRAWNPSSSGVVHALAVRANGNVFAGGTFNSVDGKSRPRLAELTPSGAATAWRAVVTQFAGATCPPRCSPAVHTLSVSAAGDALYFGGHFGLVNGVARNNAAAVRVSDAVTLPWNPYIDAPNAAKPEQAPRVYDIELGSLAYLCGDFWQVDGGKRSPNIAAVDLLEGHRQSAFNATTDGGTPACVLKDGLLYVGGHFGRVGPRSAWVFTPGQKATLSGASSEERLHLAAFGAATGAVDAWDPSANSAQGVHALAASPSHLAAGGDFTRIGGVTRQGFAQFSVVP